VAVATRGIGNTHIAVLAKGGSKTPGISRAAGNGSGMCTLSGGVVEEIQPMIDRKGNTDSHV